MKLLLLSLLLPSCADYALSGSTDKASYDMADTAAGGGESDADTDADADDDGPPEEESDYLRLAPAATDTYVFVANPGRDTVTRVAVSDLEVVTAEVGHIPSTVFTSSDYSLAITLDEGDDAVSVIAAETLEVTAVPIRDNMNSLSLSGDGQFAMAWYDPDRESLGTTNGVVSFNEVSFVRMEPATHYPLAVGYNPKGVRWSDDGESAVVVSDSSLAVVDLTAEILTARLIQLTEDAFDAPEAEEVVLTPDGSYAFVRQRGEEGLLVVDLASGLVERVDVGDDPTDMDVSPDGLRLAVVARSSREVWQFSVSDPYDTPTISPFPSDHPYGSIAFAGEEARALLYTNSALVPALAIWDSASDSWDERSLVKPVSSIGLSPNGNTAIVFHTRENAEDADVDDPFYNEWAVTLMETDGAAENRLLLPAEPTGYTVTDDDRWGYFIMEGESLLEALSFETLIPSLVKLSSEPVFVGTLPGQDIAWASQAHDLGRLSFYDPDAATLDTITGFELNSEIEH